jgi:gliding motility-associated-like protein
VWITIRKWNTDQYFTYLLTPSGLNFSPIVSSTGLVVGGYENNALGTLKFSADGTKLVAVHSFRNDLVELMDFDNSTGQISNPVLFRPNASAIPSSYSGVYGAAFSPNGRLLYVSSNNDNTTAASVLYQFDISSMDSTSIVASKQLISQNGPFYAGALQAGPDGKIYYATWRDTALSVIESPDNYGASCNFQYNRILMSATGEPIQFGLPNFVSSDMDSMYLPYDFFRSGGSCSSLDVHFIMNKITGADSVKWDFGDGSQSTLFSPTHIYSLGGSYDVSLTIFKNDCGSPSETITHSIPVAFRLGAFLPGDTSFCKIVPFALGASVNANQYLWNTGQTSPAILVSQPGLYWLEIVNNGCSYRDSFQLDVKPSVSIDLGPDVLVCINKPVRISAGSAPNSYLWNTGSTSSNINISLPGLYWATATNASGCMASDTLKANWGDCAVYIPTAFSPNGDGQNETFGLINGMSSAIFSMYIYNRFGQVVFKSADSFARWDGKFKGKPVPQGNYPWMITYKNKEGFIQTDKGMVMLIR